METVSREELYKEYVYEAFRATILKEVNDAYGHLSLSEIIEILETIKQTLAEIDANSKEQNNATSSKAN